MSKTLADEPYVLLMDEPFAAVDAQTRAELEDLARSVWPRTGVTILFVSDPRFTRLRTHVYAQIQQAKRGRDQTAPPSPEGATVAPGSRRRP